MQNARSNNIEPGSDYVPGGKPLTGRKVALIFAGFVATFLAANAVMATNAITSFGGLESKSSFREGVQYDRQIAAARAQDERGWNVSAHVDRAADGRVAIDVQPRDKAGQPLVGYAAKARLAHPADMRRDVEATLSEKAPGVYAASVEAPDGGYTLVIDIEKNGETLFKSRNRVRLGG